MATAMMVSPLAPRPVHVSSGILPWSPPDQTMRSKESRMVLKALGNVSNARARRERPCDACRKRKSKCVLQEPRGCVLCGFHKQECTFIDGAQPRKRKLEDSEKPESQPKKSQPADQPPPRMPNAISSAPLVAEVITPALPVPAPPNYTSVVDQTLSLQRHRHCRYIGHSSALDACLLGLSSFDNSNETKTDFGDLRRVTESDYFSTRADADIPIPDDEARALAEIERLVTPHGATLIDIYFRNVHPSFPVIQKQVFLDRHQHGDRQFNPPLLAAIYLLALQWWSQVPTLASHTMPDVKRLELIAFQSFTIAMQRPKVSAVQAGLLLLQRSKASTWTLTVQLVALAQDIGLHLDCTGWSVPLWERRLRKRLAWALYLQDKWSALIHGRPSHINQSDWQVQPLNNEDFHENVVVDGARLPEDAETDAEVDQGRMLFTQMIELTSIMAEVTETFYTQSSIADYAHAGRFATQLVLNRAKPVQVKLKIWFAKLPAECKMDSYTTGQLSSTGYLHLAYFATEISIHRRIVQSLDNHSGELYMLYICRSAAKTRLISAMDFVNRLQPEHLDASWYFASAANFALIGTFGALLQATSPGQEEAAFYAARLREFRWTLSISAKRAGWIESAVEMLLANSMLLRGLADKPCITKQIVPQVHVHGQRENKHS